MPIFQKSKGFRVPTLHISFSSNNVLASLVDTKGIVVFTFSSGRLKYKGSNKGTHAAAQHLAFCVAQETLNYGFFSIWLKLKGLGKGRNSMVKDLSKGGLSITKIFDTTPTAFNGCKIFRSSL